MCVTTGIGSNTCVCVSPTLMSNRRLLFDASFCAVTGAGLPRLYHRVKGNMATVSLCITALHPNTQICPSEGFMG